MEVIKTINLTKKYKDVVAVDNLNLSINEGELFALLGINGAGKSTTIKMLSTLVRPTGGNAFICGLDISKDEEKIKEIIGVSFQETAIANNLTVKENLKLICEIYGFDKQKSIDKIQEICKQFDLEEVINKKASKLSGGYKRRLSIAMSLISDPKVLFLDEPTLGLDVIARSKLWEIIKSLKSKITIILTTHYMEEAEELADRIAIMKSGHLLAIDTLENLKKTTNKDSLEKIFISIVKEEK